MFYALSKTLDACVAPLTWALVLLAAALFGVKTEKRRLALFAPAAAMAILLVFSFGPLANAMVRALESDARTTMKDGVTYDVVIVLGGFASVAAPASVDHPEFREGADRMIVTAELLRQGRARAVLVTSGGGEAEAVGGALERAGIDASRIVLDTTSTNTRDNATHSTAIARERGYASVLLVTSAMHMPRAAAAFRAAGLTFDTLAVDRLGRDHPTWELIPRAGFLELSTLAIREWTGRVVYRILGW